MTIEEAINQAVDAEPEFPGEIPESLLKLVNNDPVAALRAVVVITKKSIKQRLLKKLL